MSEFKINPELKKTIPWKLVVIFLCFSAAIILLGINYYKLQQTRIFSEYQNNLSAVASLKIRQIVRWHDERLGNAAVIRAKVPLSEMFGYTTDLRSNTQGRASSAMSFSSYEKVPDNVAKKIIDERVGAGKIKAMDAE